MPRARPPPPTDERIEADVRRIYGRIVRKIRMNKPVTEEEMAMLRLVTPVMNKFIRKSVLENGESRATNDDDDAAAAARYADPLGV